MSGWNNHTKYGNGAGAIAQGLRGNTAQGGLGTGGQLLRLGVAILITGRIIMASGGMHRYDAESSQHTGMEH